ncbi:glycosyltransferase family 4 protein [Fictibacillus phosphorivorans]|uniref:glycosyltransferase family 4 protein n=1 Tax=Fictibacillus phosphorivorans TaxID=1221500 RepID=UPI00203E1119|nr:glycosyltransferase family 4 protein [Fictibacillus phosphorivorans]MCM3717692.1 glycosyltransferase family 4 protein [Fictibacillus phosphorivorans]MCM3775592.1 glycosyltransferase family 4 protein [Fictibacillus phosphorivorans]
MNVLLLTDKLTTGGAEMYFCKLENNLPDGEVNVYAAAAPGELYTHIKHKDRFTALKRSNPFYNFWQIRQLILKERIDIIHANSLRAVLMLFLIRLTMIHSFLCIYTKHNVTILEKKAPFLMAFLLNHFVNKVITVSHFESENLLRIGVYVDKLITIYNGVDLEQFKYQDKKKSKMFKVGILARVSEEKNHALFVEIANTLRDDSDIEFYVAGDGPELPVIRERIKDLQLEDKVKVIGNVKHPESFISEMDVLLLTSKREVFPMVVLEAMAVGTPMISIDRGGIKEAIIDSETGILIADHSIEAFCSKIKELKENKLLRLRVIERARDKVKKEFSLNQMVELTYQEYQKQRKFFL